MGYDDTLDAFGLHGVGGVFGGLLTGVFATKTLAGTTGLLQGNWHLMGVQLAGIVLTIAVSVVMTWSIAKIVGFIVPLRIGEKAELTGVDLLQHGESLTFTK